MKILSVETSGKICAVALLEDDNVIKEEIIEDENTHSVKLMPLIDNVLKQTNTNLNEIDLFACDVGPGSFTGIRIGIATIKAFVDVTNKKAIGITSLEALAYNVQENGLICSLIDAKNDNVYFGLFNKQKDNYKKVQELKFDNIENIINMFKGKKEQITFVGNGSMLHIDKIKSKLSNANIIENEDVNKLNAKNIAIAAYYNKKSAGDTNILIPQYLRESNAERLLKK